MIESITLFPRQIVARRNLGVGVGQKVAAVVQWREGQSAELAELDAHARTHVAGYKVPRELHAVEQIQRSPSGKPDYPWAKELATAGAHKVS